MNVDLKSKAKLKSRRGMLELDLILQHFVEHQFDHLSLQEKKLFLQLLDQEDSMLQDYLVLGVQSNRADFSEIIEKIRN